MGRLPHGQSRDASKVASQRPKRRCGPIEGIWAAPRSTRSAHPREVDTPRHPKAAR